MPDKKQLDSLRKVMSEFYYTVQDKWGTGTREKLVEVNFQTLRNMAHKDTLVGGIIKKRCDQIKPFCKISTDQDARGFRVLNVKKDEVDDRGEELQQFFLDTGFGYDVDREDDMMDVADMLIRDTLVIDQIGIELRRTRGGDVYDFWVLDGSTVKRLQDTNGKYKFRQVVDLGMAKEHKVDFTPDDLIFDYMNKRTDVKFRGYGYSPLEQSIDIVTTFLFAITYNRDQFVKDKIPKGFIKVLGDVSPTTISTIQRYWRQQMEGYGAKFRIPVIPSGKEGVGMDFQKLGDNNREMEYHKLMQMVMSIKATVFGIDLAELGIKSDDSQALIGDSGEPRIQHSKDSGLGSLLMYLENVFNKILRKVDEDYRFEFVGVKDDDIEKEARARKQQIETYRTINEVRAEEGLDEIDEDYANVVLNPQAVSIYNAAKQAEMMGGMGGEEGEEGEEEYGAFGGTEEEEDEGEEQAGAGEPEEEEGAGGDVEKSLLKSKRKLIII